MTKLDFDRAPDTLVDPAGHVRYGVWREPLREVDADRARFRVRGLPAPRLLRKLRTKEWQHFLLVTPDLLATLAIVDLAYLKVAWLQVARDGADAFEHERKAPRLRLSVARSLWDERTRVHARGFDVDVHNHLRAGEHHLTLDVAASKRVGPAVRGELRARHDLTEIEPLVVSLPVGPGRTMYSHKVPLPVEGYLQIGESRVDIGGPDAFLILDIHKAHYPRRTFWRWATFAGRDRRGRAIGLNLTDNVVLDPDRWSENALWVDGRCERLSRPIFQHPPDDTRAPWRLTTEGGEVALDFHPEGGRGEDLNLGLVRSRFDQPRGRFRGTVTTAAGETVEIDGLRGVCEDHLAVW
ncbi:MAG: DUF2804 domain-containing protein [Deltaproteobacteria bacterium]|nr:MAG: DUF2804 domain-containing protein [Deltaproteobacteria bacterium]